MRPSKAAHGVGGAARVINVVLFPLCLGQVLGIIETTVLADNVPHILSVNLLEYLGSVIDLPRNTLQLERLGRS
eukprot:8038749-Pyramimonas_sp.AAC.1